jgi:hypothetical protein
MKLRANEEDLKCRRRPSINMTAYLATQEFPEKVIRKIKSNVWDEDE